jgi:hypothetical protein
MRLSEKTKGKFHVSMLLLATLMGAYNLTQPKRKNRYLAAFYGMVIGVEVLCVLDHRRLT